jgi:signal transduction histidine kinase
MSSAEYIHVGVSCVLGSGDVPPSHRDSDSSTGMAQLLSLVSHELRTPASVIGGYLRMLLRETDPALGERQHKMVEEAEKSCGRIVALLGELSEIAKLDAGTAAVTERSFDLFPMLEELADSVLELEDREVVLHIRGETAGAVITGDLASIRAAFAAFFRAVMREQPASCRVAVDCRRVQNGSDTSAVVIVAREDDIERAYNSVPAPFNELRGGLGLVLPIARRVVERHGGRVWSPKRAGGLGTSMSPTTFSEPGAIIVSFRLQEQGR